MHSHASHSSTDLSQIPQGAQYGSRGTSLEVNTSPFVGYKIKVELDLSRLQHSGFSGGGDSVDGGSCSLEALGIVAARVLDKGRFRSNLSYRFSQKYDKDQRQNRQSLPPRGSAYQPVVVKRLRSGGVASGSSLKPGEL